MTDLNASLEKKNGELESKNEEITSFAFVASHDLREPLRKIHTFSDWLLTKEPSLSETGRINVEKMTGAAAIIKQMADWSAAVSFTQVKFPTQGKVSCKLIDSVEGRLWSVSMGDIGVGLIVAAQILNFWPR